MFVSYDKFHPEVLPFFPGVPEIVVTNAIRNACIEFCDKSGWWMHNPEPLDLVSMEDEYDLTGDLPSGECAVARVEAAWCNNLQLLPKSEEELRRIYNLDWRAQLGRPAFYTHYEPTTLVLCPRPAVSEPAALALTLTIRPTRASTKIDQSVHERWAEVIAAGARARLHETPGQAYENIPAADRLKVVFNTGISQALRERQRGLTRAMVRVRPPRLV